MTTQERRKFDALCITHRIRQQAPITEISSKALLAEKPLKSIGKTIFFSKVFEYANKMTLTKMQQSELINPFYLKGKYSVETVRIYW